METYHNSDSIKLREAHKQVKRIKGFYTHAAVYVFVNLIIVLGNFFEGNSITFYETWSTALFWGIGLAAHAFSVFGFGRFLGKNWEEKKIQELMNK